jgi:hypothetical protein
MQEATGEEDGPEPAQKGPGPAGLFGSAQGPFGPVRDALCPRCSSIYGLRRRRLPHRTNHSTDAIHQKTATARLGRELDELVARINAGGGKEARTGLQAAGLGCSQASSPPSSSTTFFGVSITPMCFKPCMMMG